MMVKSLMLMWLILISSVVEAGDKILNKYYCHNNYHLPTLVHEVPCTDLVAVGDHWLINQGRNSGLFFFNKISQNGCVDLDEVDQEFIKAYVQFSEEAVQGAVSGPFLTELDAQLRQCQEQNSFYQRLLDIRNSTHPFSDQFAKSLTALAVKRHALSLRILGHVYQLGIGVKVNLSIAWAFYDTYNLVAGNDGQDEYRDQVTEKMTELQILEAQGQARIFRDLYTDAWKTPSTSIIN
jgi:hypothetical protein